MDVLRWLIWVISRKCDNINCKIQHMLKVFRLPFENVHEILLDACVNIICSCGYLLLNLGGINQRDHCFSNVKVKKINH